MTTWRERHRRRVAELEAAAAEMMTDALDAVLARVAGNLGVIVAAGAGESAVNPDDLSTIPTLWGSMVDDVVLPWFGGIFEAGGVAAEEQLAALGIVAVAPDRDFLDQAAVDHLARSRGNFAGLGDEAWGQARAGLLEGFREGEGIDALRRRVTAATGLSRSAAEQIARTEVIGASNMGAEARVAAMGDAAPPYRQWLSTMDARTRPTHVRADGQVVPRWGRFQVGSALLKVPADPAGPRDEVVNCRCTVLFTDSPEPLEVEGRQVGGIVDHVAEGTDVTPDEIPEVDPEPDRAGPLPGESVTEYRLRRNREREEARRAETETRRDADALGPNARNSPGGRPVSAAVDLAATDDDLREGTRRALAAINRVHGDGALRSLAVRDSGPDGSGFYEWGKSIRARATAPPVRQAQVVIHEIGHWLDHQALPAAGMRRGPYGMATDGTKVASLADLDADPLADALFNLTAKLRLSPEVKELRAREQRARDAGTNDVKWYRYLQEETEVFARAYHQWIARRAGDADLWEDFVARRDAFGDDPVQWSDETFEPLAQAFDDYFRTVGWIADE